jgi:putative redox protein
MAPAFHPAGLSTGLEESVIREDSSLEQRIAFDNEAGERLSGTLHLPETAVEAGVVLSHCFTCSRHTSILRWIGGALAREGVAALRFDFSGNGQSDGDFSESTFSKMSSEIDSAVRRIEQEGARWVGLLGHSLGASISVLNGANAVRVRAVCAIAGRLSGTDAERILSASQQEELKRDGRVAFTSRGRNLTLTRSFFEDARRFDLPATLRRLGKPLLVVHGDRDEIVPVMEADRAGREAGKWATVEMIPGGDHMFSDASHRQQLTETVVSWFLQQSRS